MVDNQASREQWVQLEKQYVLYEPHVFSPTHTPTVLVSSDVLLFLHPTG